MILGEDYTFRDDIKETTVPIEILTGPFKGTVYRYNNMKVIESEEEDKGIIKFDFIIHETNKKYSEEKLRNSDKFHKHIGLILNALILESLDKMDPDANRENNIKTSSVE